MILIRRVTSADGSAIAGQIRIRKLVYTPAGATDSCTLKDGAGNTLFALTVAAISTMTVDFNDEGLFLPSGHQVSAISAGGALSIFGS